MGSLFRWALIVNIPDEFSCHEGTQLFWLASLTPGHLFSCVHQEVITLKKHISTNCIGSEETAIGNCTTSFASVTDCCLFSCFSFLASAACDVLHKFVLSALYDPLDQYLEFIEPYVGSSPLVRTAATQLKLCAEDHSEELKEAKVELMVIWFFLTMVLFSYFSWS